MEYLFKLLVTLTFAVSAWFLAGIALSHFVHSLLRS
jgi:hypothetical protein